MNDSNVEKLAAVDPAGPAAASQGPAGEPPSTASLFIKVFPSIMLPMFMAVADQTIVATALPAIASGLGEIERASWVVVSYLIANTIAAPVYGRLGDTYGRRSIMIAALAIFMIGSVLCAVSPNIELLTAARVLKGFGGGGLMTLSQALIGEAIPPRERGQYQGYLAGVAVTSSTFGPVAGGYLTQAFGWQSIFLVNIPLGLIAFVLVLRLEGRPGDRRRTTFDAPGLVLFTLFVAPVILALEQLQRMDPQTVPMALGLLGLGLLSFVLLLWQEQRNTAPLLPPALFKNPAI
jgi:multidrug resistance protein